MKFSESIASVKMVLTGKVVSEPELVSKYGNTKVLSVTIENKRLSGVVDLFSVHFPNTLGIIITQGMFIEVQGDIRSINSKDGDKAVYRFVMANDIKKLPEEPKEYRNDVEIYGAELTEFEGVRSSYTDKSQSLATYHIKVMRKHGRFGLFRVTTWGKDAIFLGNIHKSVSVLDIKGRLQSFVGKNGNKLSFGIVTYYVEVPDKDESTDAKAGEIEAKLENETSVEKPIEDTK